MDYQQQAEQFLKSTGTEFSCEKNGHDYYFLNDKQTRDIYRITLANERHIFKFTFGQSYNKEGVPPTPYDCLAGITKYEPPLFTDFCSEYGYTFNSTEEKNAIKNIYKSVCMEWCSVEKLFTADQLEELRKIS